MGAKSIELMFLGTRGGISVHSRHHRRHSSLFIRHKNARIMIDCGSDWVDRLRIIAPTAIVLTHAHPDHAAGLAKGAPCPVYATEKTLELIARYPLDDRRPIPLQKTTVIGGLRFQAVPVAHSIRAPAVGYRISSPAGPIFYVPDVANLPNAAKCLRGIILYIGDGATMKRSMARKRGGILIGHAPVTAQLGWCVEAKVCRAIFTHCGSAIVRGEARALNTLIRQMGDEYGIDARWAGDGDRFFLTFDGQLHRFISGRRSGDTSSSITVRHGNW